MQSPMQFKTFVWPNNPETYEISYRRNTVVLDQLGGMWTVQELGRTARTFSGEGVFFGETAYEDFRLLALLFYDDGYGILTHPQWMPVFAHLSELSLTQEPQENLVRYRFKFIESAASSIRLADTTVVLLNDRSLEQLCEEEDISMEELLRLNPTITTSDTSGLTGVRIR